MQSFVNQALSTLFSSYRGKCTILLYHHVVPESYKQSRLDQHLYVSKHDFEKQLNYLNNVGHILSMSSMMDYLVNEKKFPPNSVVITFDDGHIDNYKHAFPLLNQYDAPALFYLATRFINGDDFLWRHKFHDLLKSNDHIKFKYNEDKFDYDLSTFEAKKNCFKELSGLFVRLSLENRKNLIEHLYDSTNTKHQTNQNYFLSWGQINEFANSDLVSIGSHTRNHVMLSRSEEEKALKEIRLGKEDIENKLNVEVPYFSYPYGKSNAASTREFGLAKEAGVKNAVTTRFAHVHREHTQNLFALPRISINGTIKLTDFKHYLTGFKAFINNKGRRVITD